jgi:acyl carrier protein
MNDDEILDGIVAVARQHLDFTGELTIDSPLVASLALDSLRLLTLVMEVENRFRVSLEVGEEAAVETAGQLVALVRDKLATDGAAAGPETLG